MVSHDKSTAVSDVDALRSLSLQLPRLDSIGSRCNVFRLLDVARAELVHSRMLAWLLDPMAGHGAGDAAVQALLRDLLDKPTSGSLPFDVRGLRVEREWQFVDILIVCPAEQTVVIIENKVDSDEHDNQLARYERLVNDAFPGCRRVLVYLTPDARNPSSPEWRAYGYERLARVLTAALKDLPGTSSGAQEIIRQYLWLLEEEFMSDSEARSLCDQFCREHPRAVELLVRHVEQSRGAVLQRCANEIEKQRDWLELLERRATDVGFLPRSWLDLIPAVGNSEHWHQKSWFALWLWGDTTYLELSMYVGTTSDRATRKRAYAASLALADSLSLFARRSKTLSSDWTCAGVEVLLASGPGATHSVDDAVGMFRHRLQKLKSFEKDGRATLRKHLVARP